VGRCLATAFGFPCNKEVRQRVTNPDLPRPRSVESSDRSGPFMNSSAPRHRETTVRQMGSLGASSIREPIASHHRWIHCHFQMSAMRWSSLMLPRYAPGSPLCHTLPAAAEDGAGLLAWAATSSAGGAGPSAGAGRSGRSVAGGGPPPCQATNPMGRHRGIRATEGPCGPHHSTIRRVQQSDPPKKIKGPPAQLKYPLPNKGAVLAAKQCTPPFSRGKKTVNNGRKKLPT